MINRSIVLMFLLAAAALASGDAAPWDMGLARIASNLTGPTAYTMALVGGVIAFGPMAVRGMDLHHFGVAAMGTALVGGALLSIPAFMRMFGISGAMI